ncbi:MAG TPA: arginase family protein, partial [Nitrososphaerales archaeon]|nr:arginase family protein [Nitrososphaerales archaeon]
MREAAEYPAPSYRDPNDRRMVQIIRKAARPMPQAVNILGIPFDGAVLGRKGAVGGPQAIRQSMGSFSNYNVELGVGLEGGRVFDLGDLVLGRGTDVLRAHRQIESELSGDLLPSSLLAILGGDNSISLPALRASGRKFGRLGLVVIDSHFDLRGKIGGRPTSGSSYGLALETVPSLDPRRVAEVGIHGFLNSRKYFEKA